jgi:hypothetical protein
MFKSDLNNPFNRAIFVIIGLMIVGFGLSSLQHVGLMYQNWWGAPVFGPFAIVVGIVFIVLMFKLGSLQRIEMNKHPRKSAKRNRYRF